jgi:ribonuclease P/MRP protein subunit POP5
VLREKKRYLAYEVIADHALAYNDIATAIHETMDRWLGEVQMAHAGIMILDETWNQETQRGLIRINHNYLDYVKSGLLFVDKIDSTPVLVKSVGASGIIKKAKNYLRC